MSYLHTPRLVFTGDFLSDVSTVNNDTTHYNNDTFVSSFQLPNTPDDPQSNGWWNPVGGAVFNWQNCAVQQVTLADGTVLTDPAADSVLHLAVNGAEGRPSGKMVDLDPDMQMVSALWCVQVRLCTPANEVLLQGDLLTTSFRDLQMRQTDGGANNGQPLGGSWTSVLSNLVWGPKAAESRYLSELRATTHDNQLSVNLNAFGYHYNHSPDGRFSLGRILGAIGPWFRGEPNTFAPARRLYGMLKNSYFAASNFIVEPQSKRLTVDFGSSFPVANDLGSIGLNPTLGVGSSPVLLLAVSKQSVSAAPSPPVPPPLKRKPPVYAYLGAGDFIEIGPVSYSTGSDWLNQTGGIVSIADLSDEVLGQLANNQLLLLTPSTVQPGKFVVIAREALNGQVVRADDFVQRLDTGDQYDVAIYAYQWGRPLANATITATVQPPTPNIPVSPTNPTCELYGNNYPADGLTFPATAMTDASGRASLPITGNAIHSPRVYIDGQIYIINFQQQGVPNDYDKFAVFPDVITVHLRDEFAVKTTPTWADIAPTMIQYANLYPIMSKHLFDLANPVRLLEQKAILKFAFSCDINQTMHMPVTRDLSRAKRQTILNWLDTADPVTTTTAPAAKTAARGGEALAATATNPVPDDTPLTASQQQYRDAVKAKNGGGYKFPVVDNLFENI